MEIIRHKTQKIIVIAMLTIMIMCIATPVFAARNLEFKSNMEVTKLNKDYELKEKYTTGQKVWWNTEGKGVITIVNGGLNRYGKTFVRFQANKEGKEYLIAKDAETNGKEVARCLVEVKLPDSGKKDDGKQPAKNDWEMPDWNIELPEMDYEMPDLNIDTSGIGQIGEGLISGIGQIGESGIFENLFKMITDFITGIIDSLKNINFELPAIGNTNIFKPEEKVLKLDIEKKELKVGETTSIKTTVNGEEVGKVTYRFSNYKEDGTQTSEILYSQPDANSIKAKKVGKVVITAIYKYKEGLEEKEISAQEEIKIKSRTLKLEIGKTNMNVDETTNLKATIDGKEVEVEFYIVSYDKDGKTLNDDVVKIEGKKVTALKAGKADIKALYEKEKITATVTVQIKEKTQQQNPPSQGTGTGNNSNTYYEFPQLVDEFYITSPWAGITEEQQRNNMNEIIKLFRNNTTYNDAVIAGVLGNARCESYYNPNNKTKDTNGVYSYGIWQNNEKGRYQDLVKFCEKNGYTATSLKGQTMFVIHCMESGGVGNYNNIPNTETGAQTAADLFRREYEISGAGKSERKNAAKHIFNIMQR